MNVSHSKRAIEKETAPSAESFVTLLRTEVESNQWKLIVGTVLSQEVTTELKFETALHLSIEKGLIKPDLGELCDVLITIDCHDIIGEIQKHAEAFQGMKINEFQNELLDQLESDDRVDHANWISSLKEYPNNKMKLCISSLMTKKPLHLNLCTHLLTDVKEELMRISVNEETSEIAFLKAMNENENGKSLEVIDFISIISEQDPSDPKVFCLIGNPGCGKTYLCKYLALQYGNNKHTNFKYVLTTQCRSEEWHTMEKLRQDEKKEIDEEFIQKWFSYTLPVGIGWPRSLAKHLTESGGEGLLLIIDGIDEFIKEVPFNTTLLYFLLQKRWNDIRNEHAQVQGRHELPSARILPFVQRQLFLKANKYGSETE